LIGKPHKLKIPGINACEKQCLQKANCNTFQVFITTKVLNCYLFREIFDNAKEDSENPAWGKDREPSYIAGVDPAKYSTSYSAFATYVWRECLSYDPYAKFNFRRLSSLCYVNLASIFLAFHLPANLFRPFFYLFFLFIE
jgi:hypothetical protein